MTTDSKESKQHRQNRTSSLDNRLYIEIRVLSEKLGVGINDLLEEGMVYVLGKHGINDPRK